MYIKLLPPASQALRPRYFSQSARPSQCLAVPDTQVEEIEVVLVLHVAEELVRKTVEHRLLLMRQEPQF